MKALLTISLLAAFVAGCSSDIEERDVKTTTSVPGDTCGRWYYPDHHYVEVSCSDTLTCYAETITFNSGYVGVCHLKEAALCDGTPAAQCAPGWSCTSGRQVECLLNCKLQADCPGPFQLCDNGICRFRRCPPPGTADAGPVSAFCSEKTHCDPQGLCVPD